MAESDFSFYKFVHITNQPHPHFPDLTQAIPLGLLINESLMSLLVLHVCILSMSQHACVYSLILTLHFEVIRIFKTCKHQELFKTQVCPVA